LSYAASDAASATFWVATTAGVDVAVRVQPKSRRPGLHGVRPGAAGTGSRAAGLRLAIAVAEPAEDGRANRAACATLARALGVAPADVAVAAGATSRDKILRIAGVPDQLAARLAAL
jgi:uncharacterized protein YggU (UPF0235/DUF167 family)